MAEPMSGGEPRHAVDAFLDGILRRRFQPGSTDDAMVAAEWWQTVHGDDPASEFRGGYSDLEEAAALLRRHGHLPRLVARLARRIGAARTNCPQPGDIAIVRHRERFWCAIMTSSGRWAVKCHDGLAALRNPRIVAAWSVGAV